MRRLNCLRFLMVSIVTVSVAVGYSPLLSSTRSASDSTTRYGGPSRSGLGLSRADNPQAYVVKATGQGSECRSATPDEAELVGSRVPDPSLHVITPLHRGIRTEA